QGIEKHVFPAGTSVFAVDGFEQWILVPTVGKRLQKRKKKTSEEDFRLMLGAMAGVKPAKLRAAAQNKRKDSEAFRRHLARLKMQSQKPIFRESDEAQRHKFLYHNWNKWGTVKNLRAREKPALHAWNPRAIFNLLKEEGHLHFKTRYSHSWFKRVRRHLG